MAVHIPPKFIRPRKRYTTSILGMPVFGQHMRCNIFLAHEGL
ncbi:WSSV031 [White spot syndrome virus]|uniref:WSSV031 n=1 Tax=White spot syndrome virus TaxID=342409 RepID=A0A2I6SBH1_9VIRU|nr:WSSV031 [White spot syndrome virus]